MAMQARRALGLLTHACMQCVTEQDDAFNQGMQDMQSMFASVTSRDPVKGARKRHSKAPKREQIGFGKSCEKCRKAKTKCSGDRPCARCLRLDVSVHAYAHTNASLSPPRCESPALKRAAHTSGASALNFEHSPRTSPRVGLARARTHACTRQFQLHFVCPLALVEGSEIRVQGSGFRPAQAQCQLV